MIVRVSTPYEELRIMFAERTPDGFRIQCTSSLGDFNGMFRIPFSELDAERALASVDRFNKAVVLRGGVPRESIDPIAEIGATLFSALFEGSLAELYRHAVDRSASAGNGIRLRLAMSDPVLTRLPWEFLYDSARRDFVALSAQTSVVREAPEVRSHSFEMVKMAKDEPVRVLSVSSAINPSLQPGIDEEIGVLGAFAKDSQLKLDVLQNARPAQFLAALGQGDYEVIIFSGSAIEDEGKSEWIDQALAMRSEEPGRPYTLLQGRLLMKALERQKNLRLLYFSASNSDLLARMSSRVVPMTVGIRDAVTELGCIVFTKALFENALDGQWLDAAISNGRRAIDRREPGNREWGMPVCYTSVPGGLRLREPRESVITTERDQPIIETENEVLIGGLRLPRRKPPAADPEEKRRLGGLQKMLTLHAQNLEDLKKQAGAYSARPDFLQIQIEETEKKCDELRQEIEEII
jgi:CHAT domain